jgi:hypothetical protein
VLLGWAERLQGHRDGPTPLTVVLEMFSLGQQRLIDAYMDRSMDMADLQVCRGAVAGTDGVAGLGRDNVRSPKWPCATLQQAYDEGEEGFDIENHYGALLELSRDLGVAVKAGFVPREVARLAPKGKRPGPFQYGLVLNVCSLWLRRNSLWTTADIVGPSVGLWPNNIIHGPHCHAMLQTGASFWLDARGRGGAGRACTATWMGPTNTSGSSEP